MKTIIGVYAIGLISLVVECAKLPQESRVAAVGKDWYCQTICEGGCGGSARLVDNICCCAINEPIDDGDVVLIQKTAKTIGMPIKFETSSCKRSTDDFNVQPDKTSSNKDAGAETDDKVDMDDKPVPKSSSDDNNSKHHKTTLSPKKFTLKPLKPLLADLRARFGKLDGSDVSEGEEPLLGQIDPTLEDTEPHHNIFTPQGMFKGGPLLGQINPSIKEIEPHHNIMAGGYGGHGYPLHLTPALTRSLLMNVREKLDGLLLRTVQYPYQPAVTAHETESMRNTLKQITQVNVNVRPVGTTFGYFFNNLVNQLAPAVRGLVGQEAPNVTSGEIGEEVVEGLEKTTERIETSKHGKSGKKTKSKAKELGKKTTVKMVSDVATTAPGINTTEKAVIVEGIPMINKPLDKVTPQDVINTDVIKGIPTEEKGITEGSKSSTLRTVGTTPKFLPEEEGDDLIGDVHADYDYEEGDTHKIDEPLPVPLA